MANTSQRIARFLNRKSSPRPARTVRLPKAMRKSAYKESRKPFRQSVEES